MTYHTIFKKQYDDESGNYRYECNGVESYSNVSMSEDEVRSSLELLY